MKVTLKNGEVKEFDSPLSVYEIAASLSAGLAKKACAAEIDGTPADLRTVVASDCALTILMTKAAGQPSIIPHPTYWRRLLNGCSRRQSLLSGPRSQTDFTMTSTARNHFLRKT